MEARAAQRAPRAEAGRCAADDAAVRQHGGAGVRAARRSLAGHRGGARALTETVFERRRSTCGRNGKRADDDGVSLRARMRRSDARELGARRGLPDADRPSRSQGGRPGHRHAADAHPSAVLLYHRVATLPRDVHRLAVTPETFRSQLATLTRGWAGAVGDPVPPPSARPRAHRADVRRRLPRQPRYRAADSRGVRGASDLLPDDRGADRRRRYWWDVLEAAVLTTRGSVAS